VYDEIPSAKAGQACVGMTKCMWDDRVHGEAISVIRVPFLRLFIFASLRLCEKKSARISVGEAISVIRVPSLRLCEKKN